MITSAVMSLSSVSVIGNAYDFAASPYDPGGNVGQVIRSAQPNQARSFRKPNRRNSSNRPIGPRHLQVIFYSRFRSV
jgi:hypothetical protein